MKHHWALVVFALFASGFPSVASSFVVPNTPPAPDAAADRSRDVVAELLVAPRAVKGYMTAACMFQLHAIMNSDSELQGLEKKHPDALVAFFAGARARAEAEIDQRYMAAIDAAKQDLSSFSSGELDSLAAAISPLNDYEDTLAFDESDPRDPDEIQAAFHRSANYIAARQAFAERLTRLGGTPSGTALIGKFEPVWKKYNDSSEQRGNAIGSGVLPLAAAAGKASVQSFLKAR